MTLLRWIAATRQRLAIFVLCGYALLLAPAGALTGHIRESSSSATTDMLLLLVVGALVLSSAYLLGILLGDLLFPLSWRERVILGRDVAIPQDDTDGFVVDLRATKTYKKQFYLLVAALVFGSGFVYEKLTDDFFSYYQRLGHKRTILRGEDTPTKVDLMKDLIDVRTEPRVRDALELLSEVWPDRSQPESVRLQAVIASAEVGGYLVSALEEWVKSGEKDRWELDLLRQMRTELAPKMMAALDEESPEFAAKLVLSVGQMRALRQREELLAYVVEHVDSRGERWRASVAALGLMRDSRSLGELQKVMKTLAAEGEAADEDFRLLAWTMAELVRWWPPSDDKAPAVFAEIIETFTALAKEGSPARRCAAAFVLLRTGDARVVEPIFELFDSEGADIKCENTHADMGLVAPGLMTLDWSYRFTLLQALAQVALGDPEVLRWAEERKDNAAYSQHIRTELNRLVEILQSKQG